MVAFSVFLFAIAVLFAVIAILIYNGKTNLIHGYHQEKVKDKAAYGKPLGKSYAGHGSGIIALLGETDAIALTAATLLMAGITTGFVLILHVQKRYNGGLF